MPKPSLRNWLTIPAWFSTFVFKSNFGENIQENLDSVGGNHISGYDVLQSTHHWVEYDGYARQKSLA